MTDLTDTIIHVYLYIEKTTGRFKGLYIGSDTNNPFEGNYY